MEHQAFISYESGDRDAAETLCTGMEESGVRCWMAPRDVSPGENYGGAIARAIEASLALVLIFSSRSNASEMVQRELSFAAETGTRIIPVRIEDAPLSGSIRFFVGASHWVDASDGDLAGRVSMVVEAIAKPSGQAVRKSRRAGRPRIHMTYDVEVGGALKKVELPFIVGVLADLSGHRQRSSALKDRRFFDVTRHNFDEFLESCAPRVAFQVASTLPEACGEELGVELTFQAMKDFGPGGVAERIPALKHLLGTREHLLSLCTAMDRHPSLESLLRNLLAESDGPGGPSGEPEFALDRPSPGSESGASEIMQEASVSGSLLDQVISEGFRARTEEQKDAARVMLETLVDQAAEGLDVPDKGLDRALRKSIRELDRRLSTQVSRILHHPDFCRLEASWRGLHGLVHGSEPSSQLRIRVMDVSWKELRRDCDAAVELDGSQVWRWIHASVYGVLGADPFAVLIGDYEVGPEPEDIAALSSIASACAAAHVLFVGAASPRLQGVESPTGPGAEPDPTEALQVSRRGWNAFRNTEDARHVALCLPRVLARAPHVADMPPVSEFDFREEVPSHDQYCWTTSAYVFGSRLMAAFASDGWAVAVRGPSGGGLVEGLPMHRVEGDAGGGMVGPTEIPISARHENELARLGFIPLCSMKNMPGAAFFSAQSACGVQPMAAGSVPLIMAVSRVAHYFMAICRDRTGALIQASDYERLLNRWVNDYVSSEDDLKPEMRARFPLLAARIQVVESPEAPGTYRAIAFLLPRYKLETLDISLRLVVDLPHLLDR